MIRRARSRIVGSRLEREILDDLMTLKPRLREKILRIAYFVASRIDRRRGGEDFFTRISGGKNVH